MKGEKCCLWVDDGVRVDRVKASMEPGGSSRVLVYRYRGRDMTVIVGDEVRPRYRKNRREYYCVVGDSYVRRWGEFSGSVVDVEQISSVYRDALAVKLAHSFRTGMDMPWKWVIIGAVVVGLVVLGWQMFGDRIGGGDKPPEVQPVEPGESEYEVQDIE